MAKTPKIRKYIIYCDVETGVWWARVPFGTYRPFPSWGLAAQYVELRHRLRQKG